MSHVEQRVGAAQIGCSFRVLTEVMSMLRAAETRGGEDEVPGQDDRLQFQMGLPGQR